MSASRIHDVDSASVHFDNSFAAYEVTIERGRIAMFETSQLSGEHGVERISNHG